MTPYAPARAALEDRSQGIDWPRAVPGNYILIVDDERAICDFLTRSLQTAGYAVRQAITAAGAIRMMTANPAALVLCDIRMPGEDGLWLMERLSAEWPQTPVVMVTAINDPATVQRCRELGAVEYVTKPISGERLVAVVQRVLAEKPMSMSQAPSNAGRAADANVDVPSASGAQNNVEAAYTLESPVRCPSCGERITTLNAIRMLRTHVNFTSLLPRRGRVLACPCCLAMVPAELTNF